MAYSQLTTELTTSRVEQPSYKDSKSYGSSSADGFSKVFEEANKSYNFTYEKVSEKDISYKSDNKNSSTELKKPEPEKQKELSFENKENKVEDKHEKQELTDKQEQVSTVNELAKTEIKPKEKNEETKKTKDKGSKETKGAKENKETEAKEVTAETVVEEKVPVVVQEEISKANPLSEEPVKSDVANDVLLQENIVVEAKPETSVEAQQQLSQEAELIKTLSNLVKKAQSQTSTSETQTAQVQAITPQTKDEQKVLEAVAELLNKDVSKITKEDLEKILKGNVLKTTKNDDLKNLEQNIIKENFEKENNIFAKIIDKMNNKTVTENNTQVLKQQKETAQTAQDNLNKNDAEPLVKVNVEHLTEKADLSKKSDVLKPIINQIKLEKIEVSSDRNPSGDNFDFKQQSFQMNNIESAITKLSLNKDVAEFGKTLSDSQQKLSTTEQNILDQVSKKAAEQLNTGKMQVNIILKPEELGKVRINIVSNNGVMTAQITAESQQAKEALTKGLDALKQNLQDQGVKVGAINIKVQEPAQSNMDQFDFQQNKNNEFNQTASSFNENNEKNVNDNQAGVKGSGYSNKGEAEAETEAQIKNSEIASETKQAHEGLVDYTV